MTLFLLGILFTLVSMAWGFANPKRLRWLSRMASSAADAWEPPKPKAESDGKVTVRRFHRSRRNPSSVIPQYDPVRQAKVTEALVYLGVPKSKALRVAQEAMIQLRLKPDASFDDHFKAAVGIAKEQA